MARFTEITSSTTKSFLNNGSWTGFSQSCSSSQLDGLKFQTGGVITSYSIHYTKLYEAVDSDVVVLICGVTSLGSFVVACEVVVDCSVVGFSLTIDALSKVVLGFFVTSFCISDSVV